MSILVLMTFCLPAVLWVRLHQRDLQNFLLGVLNRSQDSLDTVIPIPTNIKRSLWCSKDKKKSFVVISGKQEDNYRCQLLGLGGLYEGSGCSKNLEHGQE